MFALLQMLSLPNLKPVFFCDPPPFYTTFFSPGPLFEAIFFGMPPPQIPPTPPNLIKNEWSLNAIVILCIKFIKIACFSHGHNLNVVCRVVLHRRRGLLTKRRTAGLIYASRSRTYHTSLRFQSRICTLWSKSY